MRRLAAVFVWSVCLFICRPEFGAKFRRYVTLFRYNTASVG